MCMTELASSTTIREFLQTRESVGGLPAQCIGPHFIMKPIQSGSLCLEGAENEHVSADERKLVISSVEEKPGALCMQHSAAAK